MYKIDISDDAEKDISTSTEYFSIIYVFQHLKRFLELQMKFSIQLL